MCKTDFFFLPCKKKEIKVLQSSFCCREKGNQNALQILCHKTDSKKNELDIKIISIISSMHAQLSMIDL